MGYCIFSKDKNLDQCLSNTGWPSLMELARVFGWESKGTVLLSWKDNTTGEICPPLCCANKKFKDGEWVKDESWPGYYCSNDYQEITIDDAKNFAEALEKALEYMSAKSLSETNAVAECDDYGWDEDCLDDIHSLVNAWSSLDGQKKIKGFIKLFQSGPCNIG